MISSITTAIRDHFTTVTHWQAISALAAIGTVFGSMFFTQSGMDLIDLVDNYCATFVIINLAVFELITFCYIYGVERLCKDLKFMLNYNTGYYYRICWRFLTPGLMMLLVLFYYYNLFFPKHTEGADQFPFWADFFGYALSLLSLCHLPIIMLYEARRAEGKTYREKFRNAFRPLPSWGPLDKDLFEEYKQYLEKH